MYRVILRAVRVDGDGNEVPNADQTYRFRVRIRPDLRLTGTGNYNLLEGISLGDIEENRVFLSTTCLLYTSPSPRDRTRSRMPSSA